MRGTPNVSSTPEALAYPLVAKEHFSKHSETSPDFPFWGSLKYASEVSQVEYKNRVPYGWFRTLLPFNAFADPSNSTFLLIRPCDSELFGGWLLHRLGDFSFFGALSCFFPFSFLFDGLCSGDLSWGKSRWPGYYGHHGRVTPSMDNE